MNSPELHRQFSDVNNTFMNSPLSQNVSPTIAGTNTVNTTSTHIIKINSNPSKSNLEEQQKNEHATNNYKSKENLNRFIQSRNSHHNI